MTAYKKPFYSLVAAVFVFGVTGLYAQEMTAPYSVFGIGDVNNKAYNRTSGMGSTGYAIKSNSYIINNNPAAIASLDRSFFVIEAGTAARFTTYKGDQVNNNNSSSKDFFIQRLSLAAKINKFWASNVGYRQFSNVNYQFNGTKGIEGSTETVPTLYQGNGGINDFYWTNAFSLGKHFNIGVKASFLTGSITQTENFIDPSSSAAIASQQSDFYDHIHLEGGAQYFTALNKKWDLAVGGKFVPQISFSPQRTLTVTQNNSTIFNETFTKTGSFKLPETYGAGFALTKNNKLTFAADYTYSRWSNTNQSGSGWKMEDGHRISAGLEFSRQIVIWNQPVERRFFQLGGYYDNSGLIVSGNRINDIGVTIGTGGSYRGMMYNLALEAGSRGTKNNGLIKENYVQLTICVSYRDFLASKGRKYD